jgi:hypothetical protein
MVNLSFTYLQNDVKFVVEFMVFKLKYIYIWLNWVKKSHDHKMYLRGVPEYFDQTIAIPDFRQGSTAITRSYFHLSIEQVRRTAAKS